MNFNVYFSIVAEEELKKGDWNPKTTKSEYTRGYRFDNDIDAIKYYKELRGFGDYMHMLINDEKYFGVIYTSRAGINIVIYIEKWEGFDENLTKDIEYNGYHYSSEEELVMDFREEVIRTKGPLPEGMNFYYLYREEGYIMFGYGRWDYDATSVYKYKDMVIFGYEPIKERPINNKEDDDMPF